MNCDGLCIKVRFGVLVGLLRIRGELAKVGISSCHRLVCGRIVWSWPWCRHAHRRRSSGRRAHSIGRPQVPGSNTASRHLGSVNSAVVLKSQRERRMVLSCYARSR